MKTTTTKITKITINGNDYEVNLDLAIKDGYLVKIPKMRNITIDDIPNGSLFRYHDANGKMNNQLYLMVNNQLIKSGQCVCVSVENIPYKTWFDREDANTTYSYWRWRSEHSNTTGIQEGEWISQVES